MRKHILACILITLFISCKKNNNDNDDGNNNGFDPNRPSFRVGTKWTYKKNFYDASGAFQGSSEDETMVVKDSIINGSKYYFNNNHTNFSFKSDGYYVYDRTLNAEFLQYKYPASKGDTYQFGTPSGSCQVLTNITVLHNDTSKIVGAKNYDKLYFYSTAYTILTCQGNPLTIRSMYSTKSGLPVYTYSYRTNNPSVIIGTSELISFSY